MRYLVCSSSSGLKAGLRVMASMAAWFSANLLVAATDIHIADQSILLRMRVFNCGVWEDISGVRNPELRDSALPESLSSVVLASRVPTPARA